jgi:hypothetical protein
MTEEISAFGDWGSAISRASTSDVRIPARKGVEKELGRCRFYGVEVVTLCRLEVTQRDKLIDAPWPELNGHASCSAAAPRPVVCPLQRISTSTSNAKSVL